MSDPRPVRGSGRRTRFLPSLFVLIYLAGLAGCRSAGPSSPAAAAPGEKPDQVIKRFTVNNFEEGRRAWSLEAPTAYVYDAQNRVDVDLPFIRFFEEEKPGATVSSGKGRFFTETGSLRSWDGVVMVSTDGARLESPWMDYLADQDLVISSAPVVVTRGASVLRGVGWQAKPDMSHMVVHNQTVEYVEPDDE